MLSPDLKNRYIMERRQGVAPLQAIARARAEASKPYCIGHTSFFPCGGISRQPSRPSYAWIENTRAAGLRQVGFADELTRSIDHKGWYCDTFQNETYRGVVLQFPARQGRAVYVAGYADPHNDGAAFVDLSPIYGEYINSTWDEDDGKAEAARRADSIAESEAEDAREYNAAWQAGSRFSDLADERANAKKELRELLAQRRGAKHCVERGEWGGAWARAIDNQARSIIRTLCENLEKMRRLANGDGETSRDCDHAFFPSNELKAAFCDGASLDSFPNL